MESERTAIDWASVEHGRSVPVLSTWLEWARRCDERRIFYEQTCRQDVAQAAAALRDHWLEKVDTYVAELKLW